MKREFEAYLKKWKLKKNRKPLIVHGARQVGKTYTIEQFATQYFDNYIKINFEENYELKEFFNTNDIDSITQNLEIFSQQKIIEGKTLIFFDEVQVCPEAIVTLRYFYEKKPLLHIIAAGSLLDHTLNNLKYSMPVGRVEFAYMYPMNFYEFLLANEEFTLLDFLKNFNLKSEIALPIHSKLLNLLRLYYFVGGMPEAVKVYLQDKSLADVEIVHESIIKSLEYDFAKYGTKREREILIKILRTIPSNLGKKIKYSRISENYKSNEIKRGINLLTMSRIIHPVYSSNASKIPLQNNINEKVFKPIFLDIGLANHALNLRILNITDLITDNEGNLAEQFIGQELLTLSPPYIDSKLFYWQREKRNSNAEVDFLFQMENNILPLEVKAGKTGTLKSLHFYVAIKNLKTAVRFNLDYPSSVTVNHKTQIENTIKEVRYRLISLPLYLVREIERLVKV